MFWEDGEQPLNKEASVQGCESGLASPDSCHPFTLFSTLHVTYLQSVQNGERLLGRNSGNLFAECWRPRDCRRS